MYKFISQLNRTLLSEEMPEGGALVGFGRTFFAIGFAMNVGKKHIVGDIGSVALQELPRINRVVSAVERFTVESKCSATAVNDMQPIYSMR